MPKSNAGSRSEHAAGRDDSSRPHPTCARRARGNRAGIERADSSKPRLLDRSVMSRAKLDMRVGGQVHGDEIRRTVNLRQDIAVHDSCGVLQTERAEFA